MPIYEYRCRQCGKVVEILQKLSDAPPSSCEACSGPLEKLVSQTAFQFKGSGWYVTDYARKTPPAAAGDTGETAKTDKPADKPGEKPADKAASPADSPSSPAASSTPAATPAPPSSPSSSST